MKKITGPPQFNSSMVNFGKTIAYQVSAVIETSSTDTGATTS